MSHAEHIFEKKKNHWEGQIELFLSFSLIKDLMAGSTSNESRPQELLKDLDDGFFLISIQVFSTKSLREAKRLY